MLCCWQSHQVVRRIEGRVKADKGMIFRRWSLPVALALSSVVALAEPTAPDDPLWPDPVTLPSAGARDLRALTPSLLEVRTIAARQAWDQPPSHWGALERPDLSVEVPGPEEFRVEVNGQPVGVAAVGLRRMPVYAAYHRFDLRLLNQLFVVLTAPLQDGDRVEVKDPAGRLWPEDQPAVTSFSPQRFSPAVHVNLLGYVPEFAKAASVSLDLGSLGELDLPGPAEARVVDEGGRTVFRGPLVPRPDQGWQWHQKVWRFVFDDLRTPGLYRLEVPGLGRSAEFRLHEGAFMAAARLHALGLFHQRSGFAKRLPFTRVEHAASHTAPAAVPDTSEEFRMTNKHVGDMARKNSTGQVAPVMEDVGRSLYPFVRKGPVDVSGGHYDAGDYSKYTTNSALMIAALLCAADNFPGVSAIDNLGQPESGDGVGDVLQIVRWEVEFLRKMQDEDGGFYFLVYPRGRAYELDVLPEHGDPQVVFPKTTVSTAAAVGALAQCAASPAYRAAFPEEARECLEQARRGWDFLQRAIAQHGLEGSFQAISHYGRFEGHRDELCYAAAALFAATGEKIFEEALQTWWPDPRSGQSARWGWWPLFESYGSAARVYAFAEQNGSLPAGRADAGYLRAMRGALDAAADQLLSLADANAFGLALSTASKRRAQTGWFWGMDFAFDFAVALQVTTEADRRTRLTGAILDALNYESGANPSNRVFVSGAGPSWRREIVNRISLNDSRTLAISGLAQGNVFSSPHNLTPYRIEGAAGLRRMFFPALDRFAFYDRAGTDAYNLRAECVSAISARILATCLGLAAQTAAAREPWSPPDIRLALEPARPKPGEPFTVRPILPTGLDRKEATVIWEMEGAEPAAGWPYRGIAPAEPRRLEAEIVWPDGRRAFAATVVPSAAFAPESGAR